MAARSNTSTAHVVITMDGKQAVNLMSSIQKQVTDLTNKLKQMEQAGQIDTDVYKQASEELKTLQRAVNSNRTAYIDLEKVVNNLSRTTLGQLQKALKECRKQMNNLTANDPKMKVLMAQYKAIDNQIGQITGQWKRQDGAIASVMKRLAAYVSIYGGFNALKEGLREVLRLNLRFSDQLADIRKTTRLASQTVRDLSDSLLKIDTRTSVEELHNLAYEAGRLGIGGGGADAVLQFVRAANQLNVALGEDLGDDAVVTLSKMADVLGLTKRMGVEKSLLAIGSAINELAQSSTASGSFLTDYASRLSGIASQAHLTAAELLAFAAASDATGQEVEVSATAMNKFVVQLQTHYKTVAQAAGLSADALHSLLTAGRTAEAVVMVLEALGNKGGLSMIAPLMKDMGSDGARLTASLATMASNIELVKQQLETSRSAFEQATSVTNEYNIKNQNAAAIMDRMRNSWQKLFMNAQNEGVVKDFADDLFELSNQLQQSELLLGAIRIALTAVMWVFKSLVAIAPALTAMFSVRGLIVFVGYLRTSLIPTLSASIASFRATGAAATQATAQLSLMARVGSGLKAIFMSNGWTAIIALVGSLGYAIYDLVKAETRLTEAQQSILNLSAGFKEFKRTVQSSNIEVNTLFARLKQTNEGTKERRDLIAQINRQYGDYLPKLLSERDSIDLITDAQNRLNITLQQSMALKAKNRALDEISQQYSPKLAEAAARLQDIYTQQGVGGVGQADVRYLMEQAQKYYDAGMNFREMSDRIWSELYRAGEEGQPGGRSYGLVKSGGALSARWKEIQTQMNSYLANFYNQNIAIRNAQLKYDRLIGDYTEGISTVSPFQVVETEKESDRKKRDREQLKEARDQARAVMSAIDVYYEQERQVVNDAYLKKQLTVAQREQELTAIEQRYLRSRIAARAALHDDPGAMSDWTLEIQTMYQERLSQSEATDRALQNIAQKDLRMIGDTLRRFGEAEDDGIWKRLEEDRKKTQEIAIKMQQEIDAILRQNDYEARVTEQFTQALNYLELLKPRLVEAGTDIVRSMGEATHAAMMDLKRIYPDLFGIDIDTEEGMASFKKMLTQARNLSDETVRMTDDQLRLLYYKTVEYGDRMTEASERARVQRLKVSSARYRKTGAYTENLHAISREESTVDVYKAAQTVGLATDVMVNDAEVKLYEARLKAAQDYYEYLRTTGADTTDAEIKLQEAAQELAARASEKVVEQLKLLKNYGENLEKFGEEFGTAMFGSLGDRQQALQDFVNSVAKSTQQLILEWVKQRIEHALLRRAMVKDSEESQEDISKAESGESSMGIVERTEKKMARALLKRTQQTLTEKLSLKKKSAKQEEQVEADSQQQQGVIAQAGAELQKQVATQVGNLIVSKKKQQAAEAVSTQAAETQANATMGIASGAAKTIGELGWWGIPLVAVITALINALLSAAMSKVSSLFGGSGGNAAVSTKIVTGMLTYDRGNLGRFVMPVYDDGTVGQALMAGSGGSFPVMGDDGRVYQASQVPSLRSGLYTRPTVSLVNGQPGLIAERGPELVIGRQTTRMMMEHRPDMLAGLIAFDRQYSGRRMRTYESGNVQELSATAMTDAEREAAATERATDAVSSALAPTLRSMRESMERSARVQQELLLRLQKPIQAQITKRNVVDEVADGLLREKRSGRNENVRKLFG